MGVRHRIEEFFDAAVVKAAVAQAFLAGLAPDPDLLLWEWSNRFRKLPRETSKEHGDYDTSRTPYAREIMENLSARSPVIRTIVMKAAQVGMSEVGLNYLGYIAHVAQGPCMVVCPTILMAKRYSDTRIRPMIRLSDVLLKLFGDPDSKSNGQSQLFKRFPGGHIVLTGANSGASLRSLPARFMIFEEPDAYPPDVDGEGSAVDIVAARGFTYGYRRKEYLNCTPKLASSSIIYAEFLSGDQRTYCMPCPGPDCGALWAWDQSTFRWDGDDPFSAHHVCPHCEFRVEEREHKASMMAAGVWVPKVTDPPRGMPRSYYLPGFLSPVGMLEWSTIAKDAIAAPTNYSRAKTYYNTHLGLPWTDATDAPDPDEILRVASLSPYKAREVPEWGVMLKGGADIGQDHIELHVWAIGPGQRRHLVENVRLTGQVYDPDLWARLTQTLKRGYVHPNGAVMRISHTFIDRGKWPDVVDPWIPLPGPVARVGLQGPQAGPDDPPEDQGGDRLRR